MSCKSPLPRAVVVGIYGNRGQKLTRQLLALRNLVKLVGGVDVSPNRPSGIPSNLTVFPDLEKALSSLDFDLAVLATPTGLHFEQAQLLLTSGIHVIKEKPFEVNTARARKLAELAEQNERSLYILTQRANYSTYRLAKRLLKCIKPFRFEVQTTIDAQWSEVGWRGVPTLALGGAVSDLGYHALDLIVRFFDVPDFICGVRSSIFTRKQAPSLEDVAEIVIGYSKRGLFGRLLINRHSHSAGEHISIQGYNRSIEASPSTLILTRYCSDGDRAQIWRRNEMAVKRLALKNTLSAYLRALGDMKKTKRHLWHHLKVVQLLENYYKTSRPLNMPEAKAWICGQQNIGAR